MQQVTQNNSHESPLNAEGTSLAAGEEIDPEERHGGG
jgi:hypothetical protein